MVDLWVDAPASIRPSADEVSKLPCDPRMVSLAQWLKVCHVGGRVTFQGVSMPRAEALWRYAWGCLPTKGGQ